MSSQKPAIRVRTLDGKPRERKALHSALSGQTFVRVYEQPGSLEFVVTADSAKQIDMLREKLGAAGVEEIVGGDTTVATPGRAQGSFPSQGRSQPPRGSSPQRGAPQQREAPPPATTSSTKDLRKKPYGFVALPKNLTSAAPIWHDGTSSEGRLSGEIRFELETLTPLLVGWERGQVGDTESDWPAPTSVDGIGELSPNKSVLCPLRAPWGKRPVILPGDSIKGLLRHELGALLGAPMERVGERTYSYRPNLMYPNQPINRFLEPRLARVTAQTTVEVNGKRWPFPEQLDILSMATRYDQSYFPRKQRGSIVWPTPEAEPYRGGMGGGAGLPDALLSEDARGRRVHTHIDVRKLDVDHSGETPSPTVIDQYRATLDHLLNTSSGHFSARHPYAGSDHQKQQMGRETIEQSAERAFQRGDIVWVEWDTEKKCIVSLGWHYYYRWAYTDSVRRVRRKGGKLERHGLFPLHDELAKDGDGAPKGLSPVRRLFGYTGDNEGSAGIGEHDHAQLMGRVSVNAGLEVVGEAETDDIRFLPPTFLKELGMPRPSAVEHYLQQPHHPSPRPSDKASLVTYGDALGYDAQGELAGRKFYLDRADAHTGEPWKDDSATNRTNERSTLALEASKPKRKFRFTVRFRDLDSAELAAMLVTLCPHQFRNSLGGQHIHGYCSKLGYARPLGWGTVRIEAKSMLLLGGVGSTPMLKAEGDLDSWVTKNHRRTAMQEAWLDVHRQKHPHAADYPRGSDGEIYSHHTGLRAEHSRNRRYRQGGGR